MGYCDASPTHPHPNPPLEGEGATTPRSTFHHLIGCRITKLILLALTTGLLAAHSPVFAAQAGDVAVLEPRPAVITPFATRHMMLDATRAGARIVAVGDRGVVLLSDDQGKSWRQARGVPTDTTLNAVSFVDERTGWAVGHWGVILRSSDGGETWTRQRLDTSEDRPLYSVHFSDAENGVAVGLWSLLLRTSDGGQTWQDVALDPPPGDTRADRNLMRIFPNHTGDLFIVGERGTVLISSDGGQHWRYASTGYRGSFWSGTALADGTLLIGGLRGNLYRSTDNGASWSATESNTYSSITDIVALKDKVLAVALDGVTLESTDSGAHFVAKQREDRTALTTAIALDGTNSIIFSRTGIVSD
jgi:photosystem II stability/assembly factor-like uncharacterized protein